MARTLAVMQLAACQVLVLCLANMLDSDEDASRRSTDAEWPIFEKIRSSGAKFEARNVKPAIDWQVYRSDNRGIQEQDDRAKMNLRRRYPSFEDDCQIEELAEKYLELLGYVQTGTFVEVGASDGRRWSNSYSLARMGWYGHYIEAVPEYAKICAMNHARHPRVQTHVLAIGDKEDYARVHVGSSLSTCSDQMRKLYDSLDWTQGYHTGEIVSTRQHSLEYFLRAVGIQPRFELLIVDVEGYEWEVFRNFNISEWSPQVVIVEIEDEHDSFKDVKFLQKRFRKLRSYFQDHGYDTYWKDKINTIFVYRQ